MHGSCWMLTADMSKLSRVPVMPSRLLYARRHRSMSRRAYSSAQEWLWKPQMSQPHLNLTREKSRKRITWMLIGTLSTPWTCWMSSGKINENAKALLRSAPGSVKVTHTPAGQPRYVDRYIASCHKLWVSLYFPQVNATPVQEYHLFLKHVLPIQ